MVFLLERLRSIYRTWFATFWWAISRSIIWFTAFGKWSFILGSRCLSSMQLYWLSTSSSRTFFSMLIKSSKTFARYISYLIVVLVCRSMIILYICLVRIYITCIMVLGRAWDISIQIHSGFLISDHRKAGMAVICLRLILTPALLFKVSVHFFLYSVVRIGWWAVTSVLILIFMEVYVSHVVLLFVF